MGLFDSLFGSGGADNSNRALQELKNLPIPILKEQHPELYKQIVQMNPELEQSVTLGPSEMGGITLDPQYKAAQLSALNKLQGISDAGGQDAQFLSDASKLQSNINTNLQGNTGAIQQNMATRGLSGGMSEMVAKQQAAQAAADRQSQMGLDLNAQAQQRALQALMSGQQVASNMSNQDFGQQSAKAQAADAISRFNAQNKQQVMGANVDRQNQAQQWNANTAQQVAGQNTQLNNDTQKYNSNGLAQQNYDNAYKKAGGVASGYQNIADGQNKDRDREAGFMGNIISGGAVAYAGRKG